MAHLTAKGYASFRAAGAQAGFFHPGQIRVAAIVLPAPALLSTDTLRNVTPARVRAVSSSKSSPVASVAVSRRYYAQGVIKVGGSVVSRFVRIRRRDNGEEITSGYSGADGRFHLSWADYSGMVEVTVYDDAASLTPYNAKIFDFVVTS